MGGGEIGRALEQELQDKALRFPNDRKADRIVRRAFVRSKAPPPPAGSGSCGIPLADLYEKD